MISDNFKIKKVDVDEQFELLPEGTYEVVIKDVNEKERTKYKSTETEMALNFEFEVVEGEYKGRLLWKTVSPVYNEGFEGGQPSWLYRILKACGVEVFEPTAKDINDLIGKNLKVVIEHKKSKDGTIYSNIVSFLKSEKNQAILE